MQLPKVEAPNPLLLVVAPHRLVAGFCAKGDVAAVVVPLPPKMEAVCAFGCPNVSDLEPNMLKPLVVPPVAAPPPPNIEPGDLQERERVI